MSGSSDDDLLRLAGATIASTRYDGVRYRIDRVLGSGATSIAFVATRELGDTWVLVVVKVLRPRAIRQLGGRAAAQVDKEVRALEGLAERFPPTPYVVKFLDAGTVSVRDGVLALPWIAVELVNGHDGGTTLRARVKETVKRTGYALRARESSVSQGR